MDAFFQVSDAEWRLLCLTELHALFIQRAKEEEDKAHEAAASLALTVHPDMFDAQQTACALEQETVAALAALRTAVCMSPEADALFAAAASTAARVESKPLSSLPAPPSRTTSLCVLSHSTDFKRLHQVWLYGNKGGVSVTGRTTGTWIVHKQWVRWIEAVLVLQSMRARLRAELSATVDSGNTLLHDDRVRLLLPSSIKMLRKTWNTVLVYAFETAFEQPIQSEGMGSAAAAAR